MFWDDLSAADQEAIRAVGTRCSHPAGTRLFFEGEDSTHVLLLLSGRVKLTRSSADGQEVMIELRGPGYLVGEMSAIDDAPRSASAITLDAVEAIVLSGAQFRQLLSDRGTVLYDVLTLVTQKLRQATARRLEVGTSDAQARLCRRLVELAEDADPDAVGVVEIESPLTQQEMAEWIGVSRDAVVLALRNLRKLGWIETGRRMIRILDLDEVRKLASD